MHKMPEKSTEFWIHVWGTLPEPVKAALLSLVLAIATSLKKDGRGWRDKVADTIATAVIVLIAGIAFEFFGLSGGWTYAVAGAIGGYGIGPAKAFAHDLAQRFIDRWLSK